MTSHQAPVKSREIGPLPELSLQIEPQPGWADSAGLLERLERVFAVSAIGLLPLDGRAGGNGIDRNDESAGGSRTGGVSHHAIDGSLADWKERT